jgi:hypothetical protein
MPRKKKEDNTDNQNNVKKEKTKRVPKKTPKKKKVNGRLLVNSQYNFSKYSGRESITEDREEQIEVDVFPDGTTPASVSFGVSTTVNMENYESVKITAMVTLPCYKEEIDDAFIVAKGIVDEQVSNDVRKLRDLVAGMRK